MDHQNEFQDIVNHKDYNLIKHELQNACGFQQITRVRILDKFLEKNLITEEYHKKLLKKAIYLDKKEYKYDILSSLLITSSILLFFLIVFIPEKEKFTRVLFGIYILCIYLIAYLYY